MYAWYNIDLVVSGTLYFIILKEFAALMIVLFHSLVPHLNSSSNINLMNLADLTLLIFVLLTFIYACNRLGILVYFTLSFEYKQCICMQATEHSL